MQPAHADARGAVSVVVDGGLDSPRGLAFGPDGALYVAEAGRGGSSTTEGRCRQVPPPIGPYSGGLSARVSRIDGSGGRTTIIDRLPSSQSSPGSGGLVSGVADVAFDGSTLYALVSGAGCSHGLEGTANGVYRIADGRAELVADLGTYRRTHPVAQPDPADDEYDGTWYSMVAADGELFAIEPNAGDLVRIGAGGEVTRVVDISATHGHVVPTALAWRDALFVANLGRFPIVAGASMVLRVERDGRLREWASGLTAVLGLAFDPAGRLYALENSSGEGVTRPTPGTGRLLRVVEGGGPGDHEVVASGLNLPTGLTVGPDGALYVAAGGFGRGAEGSVLRVELG